MRILILEYERMQSDLLDLALRRNGFEPVLCTDPAQVRQDLAACSPRVLMIDTRLPNANGIDVVRQLKEEKRLENVYVIVLSSLGFPVIVKEAAEAGANEFLVKPLDLDLLVARLKLVEKERQEHTVSTTSTVT